MIRRNQPWIALALALFAPLAAAAPPQETPTPPSSSAAAPTETTPPIPPSSASTEVVPSEPIAFDGAAPSPNVRPTQAAPASTFKISPPYLAPQWGVGARLGPRYLWANDAGLDPFTTDHFLIGFHLEGLVRVWQEKPFSVWVTGAWQPGGVTSPTTARGISTSLNYHNFQVGIEGQYMLWRFLALQAQLAPGVRYISAKLTPSDLPYALVSDRWTWGLDTLLGASLLLGSMGNREWPIARFWLSATGGYALSGKVKNKLESDTTDKEERTRYGTTTLPSFNLSGAQMQISFGITL